ncbi:hypothetical protein BH10PSE12_BH10PSE12_24310 [soil metagenome]
MTALSIGKAWEETVAFVKREGQLLFPVGLLFLAIPFAILMQMIPAGYMHVTPGGAAKLPALPGSVQIAIVVTVIITLIGTLALYALALKPGISVAEAIRLGVRRLPVLVGASALVALGYLIAVVILSAFAGGLALALGPNVAVMLVLVVVLPLMIFVAARLMMLNAIVIDSDMGVIASLKASWALTTGKVWRLLGFLVVVVMLTTILQMAVQAVFGVIGGLIGGAETAQASADIAVAACSGVIQVYFLVMTARIYRQLYPAG